MEIRMWASRVLGGDTIEEKLLAPGLLTDSDPGTPLFWNEPSRPPGMEFKTHTRKDKLPSLQEHHSPDKRVICLHRFAGHELLAVEIMAYALLAFPEAPAHFRRGVAHTLKEEQEHVRLYINRLAEFDVSLSDLPFYKHFWSYTPHLKTPVQYVSVMSLTFEMANLDYAPTYGSSFAKHGDDASAQLMERILQDEIAHVSFGWHWLRKFKRTELSDWDSWTESLPPRFSPRKAMGNAFNEAGRKEAKISSEWLEQFKGCIKK